MSLRASLRVRLALVRRSAKSLADSRAFSALGSIAGSRACRVRRVKSASCRPASRMTCWSFWLLRNCLLRYSGTKPRPDTRARTTSAQRVTVLGRFNGTSWRGSICRACCAASASTNSRHAPALGSEATSSAVLRRSLSCCRRSTQRATWLITGARHPPSASPASMNGNGASPTATRVHSGSGHKCQAPSNSSETTAPTSKPLHNPRNALAQRRRRAAPQSADLMTSSSLMAWARTCDNPARLASLFWLDNLWGKKFRGGRAGVRET